MQTPPAIPTMLACVLARRWRSTRLVFDWHNYGYSILALRLGAHHPAVRLARLWERWFAKRADRHLCVSAAMQKDLARNWGVLGAVVLRDLPADRFRLLTQDDRLAFRRSLRPELAEDTALLVSPSSWTADEDFSLLFEALEICDARMRREEAEADARLYPDLIILLTGRGPQREAYRQRASALPKGRILVEFAWLSQDRYAALLGAADLGICVHRSSSGLDLPMKIADMQGAGLPVCAYDYGPCLEEMVARGETGLLFKDAEQLAAQICDLLRDFGQDRGALTRMKSALAARRGGTWASGWDEAAAPLLGLA